MNTKTAKDLKVGDVIEFGTKRYGTHPLRVADVEVMHDEVIVWLGPSNVEPGQDGCVEYELEFQVPVAVDTDSVFPSGQHRGTWRDDA